MSSYRQHRATGVFVSHGSWRSSGFCFGTLRQERRVTTCVGAVLESGERREEGGQGGNTLLESPSSLVVFELASHCFQLDHFPSPLPGFHAHGKLELSTLLDVWRDWSLVPEITHSRSLCYLLERGRITAGAWLSISPNLHLYPPLHIVAKSCFKIPGGLVVERFEICGAPTLLFPSRTTFQGPSVYLGFCDNGFPCRRGPWF